MSKNSILREYQRMADGALGDFTLHVGTMMTGNAYFVTPPFTMPSLTTTGTNFNTVVAASLNTTQANTLAKNNQRTALIALLDQLANYVEFTANNNATIILSSGFHLASTAKTKLAPGMTSILSVTNVAPGKLGLQLTVADNAWAYVVECTNLTTNVVKTQTFTDPHDVTVTSLISGNNYSIRVAVMGSGNQTTEWCEPVQHMAT